MGKIWSPDDSIPYFFKDVLLIIWEGREKHWSQDDMQLTEQHWPGLHILILLLPVSLSHVCGSCLNHLSPGQVPQTSTSGPVTSLSHLQLIPYTVLEGLFWNANVTMLLLCLQFFHSLSLPTGTKVPVSLLCWVFIIYALSLSSLLSSPYKLRAVPNNNALPKRHHATSSHPALCKFFPPWRRVPPDPPSFLLHLGKVSCSLNAHL